jgi:carbamoyltransferase
MLMVADIHPSKQGVIPAVTHVDGTGRLQTVSRKYNSRFYDIIAAFKKHTGVPVLLNTSFNVAGEPIVETPEDAIRCVEGTAIDALLLGDYLLMKRSAG